jgi:hypothetical protein
MTDTLIAPLAVTDTDHIICLKVDRQATTVVCSGALLGYLRAKDGSNRIILRRRIDGRVVIDYQARPGETICYTSYKRDEPAPTSLQWHSFIAPEKAAAVIPPEKQVIGRTMWAGSLLVRTGLLWNLLAVLPTLYYFLLPNGTITDNDAFGAYWNFPISVCILFIGLPCYVMAILRRRARRLNYLPEAVALLFCLTPFFLTSSALALAGEVRGLRYPWDDGGDYVRWFDGSYYAPR